MSDRLSSAGFRVGEWVAEVPLNQLRRGREIVKVTPKVMEVLCALAQTAPEPASREHLMEVVWDGRHVGEESLTHAISELRKALGDSSKNPRYVQTIPKRGYRLLKQPEENCSATPTKSAGRKALLRVAAALALLVGLAATLLPVRRDAPDPGTERLVTPVTSRPGSESQPALSPDGERVAFTWRGDIHLITIESGASRSLTEGSATESGPAWSADGERIAFSRQDPEGCGIFIFSIDRGSEHRAGDCGPDSSPTISWHPSGSWLAISDTAAALGQYEIYFLSLATGQRQALPATDGSLGVDSKMLPSFSPEGRRLAYARSALDGAEVQIVELATDLSVTSENPATVMRTAEQIRGLDWTADGQGLVVATGKGNEGSLWRVGSEGGAAEAISLGSRRISQPSVARRGNRLVFVEQEVELNLWEAMIEGDGEEPELRPLVLSTQVDFNPTLSFDGQYLAFASTRSGDIQIWRTGLDGRDPERLTQGDWQMAATPSWSPDGERIAFSARRNDSFELLSVSASGGSIRTLVSSPANDADPAYSPDGRWLYFCSDRSGIFEIWRSPAHGGAAEQLTQGGALAPNPDRQGRYLYYSKVDVPGVWRFDLVTRESERITDLLKPRDWNNWTLAEGGLVLTKRRPDGAAEWVIWDFETQDVRGRIEIEGSIGPDLEGGITATFSRGSTRLIFAQIDRDESDLYLADGFL